MSDPAVLFLDANILASPVTRTLVIAGARVDGLRAVWSPHVEAEADRHTRGSSTPVTTLRSDILGMELCPSSNCTNGLVTSSGEDRQVMADAIRARARYLITTDVDDFAFEDLAGYEMSAVNHDYFMALRFSEFAYRGGVGLLADVAKNATHPRGRASDAGASPPPRDDTVRRPLRLHALARRLRPAWPAVPRRRMRALRGVFARRGRPSARAVQVALSRVTAVG